jgi:hypothetical protein
MPNTATQPRATPRLLPTPDLLGELRADKGPKHMSFDGVFLGAGRRAVEQAKKADKKR